MSHLSIEIDRLILTDLDMTPVEAEALRPLLEAELQRRLERDGLPEAAADSQLRTIEAPVVQVNRAGNDRQLIGGLAQSISRSLRAVR